MYFTYVLHTLEVCWPQLGFLKLVQFTCCLCVCVCVCVYDQEGGTPMHSVLWAVTMVKINVNSTNQLELFSIVNGQATISFLIIVKHQANLSDKIHSCKVNVMLWYKIYQSKFWLQSQLSDTTLSIGVPASFMMFDDLENPGVCINRIPL